MVFADDDLLHLNVDVAMTTGLWCAAYTQQARARPFLDVRSSPSPPS